MDAALDASAIDKSFGVSRVLHDVNVRVASGEVRALLGENGAGKSTLIRIIAGVLRPDAGTVAVGGSVGPFSDPHIAERNGVATLHQELAVVPGLSVAENVMLGHGTRSGVGSSGGRHCVTMSPRSSIVSAWRSMFDVTPAR